MSLVVRVIAPIGRDAELITGVLQENGLEAKLCRGIVSLAHEAGQGPIGPLLIAEEALDSNTVRQLAELIHNQPPWSDLPLLILTGTGRESSQSKRTEYERLPLGSPVLLERPIRTATLVSSVRAACRARQRQYEIRDPLLNATVHF